MLDSSREFIVLATRLNYTTAARELNVSQSTLSRHIADLERELGFQLLERVPVALTAAGKYYLESISDIIERLDAALEQGRTLAREDSGGLSICMINSDHARYSVLVYEAIARLRREQPNFRPRLYADRGHTVADAVLSGEADVGILLDDPPDFPEDFACEWLIDLPFAAYVHEDNPVLRSQPVRLEDLKDCTLVGSTHRHFSTWLEGSKTIFRKHGMQPKVHLKDADRLEDFTFDLSPNEVLLGADDGPDGSAQNPRLVKIRFNDPTLFNSAYVLYRRKPARSVVLKFVEACHQAEQERRA